MSVAIETITGTPHVVARDNRGERAVMLNTLDHAPQWVFMTVPDLPHGMAMLSRDDARAFLKTALRHLDDTEPK